MLQPLYPPTRGSLLTARRSGLSIQAGTPSAGSRSTAAPSPNCRTRRRRDRPGRNPSASSSPSRLSVRRQKADAIDRVWTVGITTHDSGVPFRLGWGADADCSRARDGVERDARRVPPRSRRADGRAVCSVRSGRRLRRVHRRQAALRRRALVPHVAWGRGARRCGDGSARRDHGPRARQPEERTRALADPDERSRRLRRLGALRAGGRRCRTRARCRLREREHARRARGSRNRGSIRGANRRDRRRGAAPAGKAGPGHIPRGRESSRGRCERGGGVRGCVCRRCRRPGRRIRLRRRSRPGRAGGGSARARRRRRRTGPRGAARVITHPAFTVEPWSVRETYLDLDMLAACESVFALSNGHIGLRGNVDEGEPFGLPGTYLNSFYELRPLPYAEAGYGNPESSQTVLNVTDGKIIRLLVDDEPFDVRYGHLRAHERVLDLRAGVLQRSVEWESPAGMRIHVRSTRLVSFVQRSAAAVLYEVEPVDRPLRVVIQSELVANEPGVTQEADPRAAAALESPL